MSGLTQVDNIFSNSEKTTMSPQSSLAELPFEPSEDPFVVEHGGFYRRWFHTIEDLDLLKSTAASLKGTTDDLWVPPWREIGKRYEDEAEALAADGKGEEACEKFLQAKKFSSLARFPNPSLREKKKRAKTAFAPIFAHVISSTLPWR